MCGMTSEIKVTSKMTYKFRLKMLPNSGKLYF